MPSTVAGTAVADVAIVNVALSTFTRSMPLTAPLLATSVAVVAEAGAV